MCPARYRAGGSLLHCLSTLTYAMGQISALSHTEAAVLGMKTFLVHGIRRISAPCLGVFHASAYLPMPSASCFTQMLQSCAYIRLRGSASHVPDARLIAYAVYFCCTVLRVASTGCYPASCPSEPGLSSIMPFRLHDRDHLLPSYI